MTRRPLAGVRPARLLLVGLLVATGLLTPATALAALEAPEIRGRAEVGRTLRASLDDAPPGVVFQWVRLTPDNTGGEAAAGPPRYTVTEADVGHRLFVRAGDPATGDISPWSAGTDIVPAPRPAPEPPRNTSEPTVSDRSPRIGDTLTGRSGRWAGTEPIRYAETWLRCRGDDCRQVATGRTYVVVAADAGSRLRFRVEATNEAGAAEARSDPTRVVPAPPTTPSQGPVATTGDVTDITATTATARGSVDTRGQAVSYRFEYGLTTAYGASTPPTPVPAGAATVPVQAVLAGLAPGTEHHVRLVVTSTRGSVTGVDVTFTTQVGAAGGPPTTPGPPPVIPTPLPPIPPPVAAVTNFTARVDANVVRLSWTASDGNRNALVAVVRRFGRKPTGPTDGTVVYRGRAQRAVDFPVARRRVWYAAFVVGGRSSPTRAVYTSIRRFYPTLLAPYEDARVGRSVRFAWRRVKGAAYYNVQIWDGRLRRRVAVRWPTTRTLRLRLRPGTYRWYVYPGYGQLRQARYGALHGQGSFRVR